MGSQFIYIAHTFDSLNLFGKTKLSIVAFMHSVKYGQIASIASSIIFVDKLSVLDLVLAL